jgi:hypothetical protein
VTFCSASARRRRCLARGCAGMLATTSLMLTVM